MHTTQDDNVSMHKEHKLTIYDVSDAARVIELSFYDIDHKI